MMRLDFHGFRKGIGMKLNMAGRPIINAPTPPLPLGANALTIDGTPKGPLHPPHSDSWESGEL